MMDKFPLSTRFRGFPSSARWKVSSFVIIIIYFYFFNTTWSKLINSTNIRLNPPLAEEKHLLFVRKSLLHKQRSISQILKSVQSKWIRAECLNGCTISTFSLRIYIFNQINRQVWISCRHKVQLLNQIWIFRLDLLLFNLQLNPTVTLKSFNIWFCFS